MSKAPSIVGAMCAIHPSRGMRQRFNRKKNSFVQYYGSKEPDASLLMIPLVGFLPAEDPRVAGTVAAIERELLHDGFVMRYRRTSPSMVCRPARARFCPVRFGWPTIMCCWAGRKRPRSFFSRLLGLVQRCGIDLRGIRSPRRSGSSGIFRKRSRTSDSSNTAMNLIAQTNNPAEHRSD